MKRKRRRNPSVAGVYRGVKHGIRKIDRAIDTATEVGARASRGLHAATEFVEAGSRTVHTAQGAFKATSVLFYGITAFIVYSIGKGFIAAYQLKMASKEMKQSIAMIKTGSVKDVVSTALQATGLKSTITQADQRAAIAAINLKLGVTKGGPLTGLTTFNKNDPAQVAAMKVKLGYTASPATANEYKNNIAILAKIQAM